MSLRNVALLAGTLVVSGCISKIATNAVADTLSGTTGGSFTQDNDLQFVGESLPFVLKLMESVHEATPQHQGMLDTLCSSYTQYAVVFIQWPAEQLRYDDYGAYEAGLVRSRKFLRRAQGYCAGALEVAHPGFAGQLIAHTDDALARATEDDIARLYWAGAAWLARISISKEDMEAIGELPFAAALLQRASALNPDWDHGSLHEMMVLVEPNLPMPGGLERAREHYEVAVELSQGTRASPHLSLAVSVSVSQQNRDEFVSLMNKALEVDADAYPENQLSNLYSQEQAQFYLDHLDDLFVE